MNVEPALLRPSGSHQAPDLTAAMAAVRTAVGEAPRVTLILNDPQRGTRSDMVLTELAGVLAGRRVRALVATGSHRFDDPARRVFERPLAAVLDLEEVCWHDARSGRMARIGSWRGHPWLVEDDWCALAIGSCEPHYFAGITGAHKTVTIGCAAYADIEANHAAALSADCRPGRLAGNPVHEGVAALLGELTSRRAVTAINLLQPGDRIVAAATGAPLDALDALTPAARAAYTCVIDRPADGLVLDVTGPLAGSFYQADKAIKNSEHAVRDGGAIVLVAPCREGVGQDRFMDLLRRCPDYDSAVAAMDRRGYRLGDHKAVRLRDLTDRRGVRVFAVGANIADGDLRDLHFFRSPTVADALADAGLAAAGGVFRVTDAGNTCVCLPMDPDSPPAL